MMFIFKNTRSTKTKIIAQGSGGIIYYVNKKKGNILGNTLQTHAIFKYLKRNNPNQIISELRSCFIENSVNINKSNGIIINKKYFNLKNILKFKYLEYLRYLYTKNKYTNNIKIYIQYPVGYINLNTFQENIFNKKQKKSNICLRIIIDITQGIVETHKANIIHGDLKPDNIVYFKQDKRWKLIDFGLSLPINPIEKKIEKLPHQYLASKAYRSLKHLKKELTHYDFSVDIFSLGIIILELVIGNINGSNYICYDKNLNTHISNIEKLIYIRKEKVVKYLLKFINIEENNLVEREKFCKIIKLALSMLNEETSLSSCEYLQLLKKI